MSHNKLGPVNRPLSEQGIFPGISPWKIFVFMCLVSAGVYFTCAFFLGERAISWLAMGNNNSWMFSDYFRHLYFAAVPSETYARGGPDACFPPLAYTLYYFLYRITSQGGDLPATTIEGMAYQQTAGVPYALLVFLYYTIAVVILLFSAILLWNNGNMLRSILIIASILLAPQFIQGGIERGNANVLVLGFLMLALKLRTMESRKAKEAALLLIAAAVGFKIYPAVFGFLYIKEGRFKEAGRLILYGIAACMIPFLWTGGIDGLKQFLTNVQAISLSSGYGRVESIYGLTWTVTKAVSGQGSVILSKMMAFLFFFLMLEAATISQKPYMTVFFLSSLMTFFPGGAYRYTLGYLTLPMVMFFCENDVRGNFKVNADVISQVKAIGFGLLYAIPIVMGLIMDLQFESSLIKAPCVELWMYVVAYVLVAFMTVDAFIHRDKTPKAVLKRSGKQGKK